jgi:proteic killer suppression protein
MIQNFRDQGTEDIFNGQNTRAARKTLPKELWPVAQRRLDALNAAADLGDLKAPPGNRLEALVGDRKGQYSIRINNRYRICFVWTSQGPAQVEIVDYH